jgi:hypothetical protein
MALKCRNIGAQIIGSRQKILDKVIAYKWVKNSVIIASVLNNKIPYINKGFPITEAFV